jgi:hypothetical protein
MTLTPVTKDAPECAQSTTGQHLWTYTGVRFRNGFYNRPGSGSVNRYYGQHYLCTLCGKTRVDRLEADHGSYEPILYGATPATVEEFPIEHEKGAK